MGIPDGETPIEIRPETVACPAHGEHMRAQFPAGFAVFALEMLQAAMANDELVRAVDPAWDGESKHAKLDVDALNAILAKRPLCYWVDRDVIRRAFSECGIAKIVRCNVCGRGGMGGPYTVSLPKGMSTMDLCFNCACDNGEAEHRLHPEGNVWPST